MMRNGRNLGSRSAWGGAVALMFVNPTRESLNSLPVP